MITQKFSSAGDIMVADPVTLSPGTPVLDGIAQLLEQRITGAPVADPEGNYLGVFSEKCSLDALLAAAERYRRDRGSLPRVSADDIMQRDLTLTTPEADALDAIERLLEKRVSGAPVVGPDGCYLGVFSEKGSMSVLLGAAYDRLPKCEVRMFMDRDRGRVVAADTDLLSLARIFVETHYRRLVILEKEKPIGQISRRDVLSALLGLARSAPDYLESMRVDRSETDVHRVGAIMDVEARTIPPEIDLLGIASIFRETPYRRLPVLKGRLLVGIVSRRDVLAATHKMLRPEAKREKSYLYLSAVAGREALQLD